MRLYTKAGRITTLRAGDQMVLVGYCIRFERGAESLFFDNLGEESDDLFRLDPLAFGPAFSQFTKMIAATTGLGYVRTDEGLRAAVVFHGGMCEQITVTCLPFPGGSALDRSDATERFGAEVAKFILRQNEEGTREFVCGPKQGRQHKDYSPEALMGGELLIECNKVILRAHSAGFGPVWRSALPNLVSAVSAFFGLEVDTTKLLIRNDQ
ncbi:MAG: hypothetical protein A2542_00410 [Parcubacteria group bacterium RIFOXYD2_FULL_52_8]|nr:MAG: hypothetical protein A2542_00410 [Parcubacteria group bacterium RIFOXYD2_FULL_52_8]